MGFCAQAAQLIDISSLFADNVITLGKPNLISLIRENLKDIVEKAEEKIQRSFDPFNGEVSRSASGHIAIDRHFMSTGAQASHYDPEAAKKKQEEQHLQSYITGSIAAIANVFKAPEPSYAHPKPPAHPHCDNSRPQAPFNAAATSPAHPHPKTAYSQLKSSVATSLDHIASGKATLNDARNVRDTAIDTAKDTYKDLHHAGGEVTEALLGRDARKALGKVADVAVDTVKKSPVAVAFDAAVHPFRTIDAGKKMAADAGAAVVDAAKDPGKAASNIADGAGKAWTNLTANLPSLPGLGK